ncbi:MAG: bifunctional nuclease family protein [Muribaculaceae bacterium]|nr:bifunctional nuclease family protein [Muribaculaceae bacterium]
MEKIKLNVMGITYSQVQNGAYALVLSEEGGKYRIPVVVGVAEAQSIAIKLENIIPPRPLSHDLIVGLSHAYGINLDEVFLYKFENGVFLSELHFSSDDRSVKIDSRTSDAIALALRTGAPIYTTREIMETTGFISDKADIKIKPVEDGDKPLNLKKFAIEELEKMLARCVEREEYERAAEIKKIIAEKREEKAEK